MAARRCSTCSIDYPTNIHACRVCGEDTDWLNSVAPDPDWEHEVELRGPHHRSSESDQVERWRLRTILDLGYSADVAHSLAISDADLHVLDRLIRQGCPLELAARIV